MNVARYKLSTIIPDYYGNFFKLQFLYTEIKYFLKLHKNRIFYRTLILTISSNVARNSSHAKSFTQTAITKISNIVIKNDSQNFYIIWCNRSNGSNLTPLKKRGKNPTKAPNYIIYCYNIRSVKSFEGELESSHWSTDLSYYYKLLKKFGLNKKQMRILYWILMFNNLKITIRNFS